MQRDTSVFSFFFFDEENCKNWNDFEVKVSVQVSHRKDKNVEISFRCREKPMKTDKEDHFLEYYLKMEFVEDNSKQFLNGNTENRKVHTMTGEKKKVETMDKDMVSQGTIEEWKGGSTIHNFVSEYER